MDGRGFDNFARALATGHPRRAVLRTLAGGVLAGLLTRFGGDEAAAKPKDGTCQDKPGGKCSDAIPCCDGFCDTGKCPCATGRTLCHGTCVKTTKFATDAHNCGACGHACPKGFQCVDGVCVCPEGSTLCAGACRDLNGDEHNCGACGRACAPSERCCDGVCRSIRGDPANCGGCGEVCAAGQTCCGGTCLVSPGCPGCVDFGACVPNGDSTGCPLPGACFSLRDRCASDADCCAEPGLVCGSRGRCQPCLQGGAACGADADCCSRSCGHGQCRFCADLGDTCATDDDCCAIADGHRRCVDGTCRCCTAGTVCRGDPPAGLCCEEPNWAIVCCPPGAIALKECVLGCCTPGVDPGCDPAHGVASCPPEAPVLFGSVAPPQNACRF